LEHALREVRWRAGEISKEEFDEHMGTIARHPAYFLVLRDRQIALAPDDERRRVLAAVFTNEADRDNYLREVPPDPDKISQTVIVTASGRDLFSNLQQMTLDGIVFNPCASDSQRVVAFQPKFAEVVLRFAEDAAAQTVNEPLFDRLAKAAFPDGAPGPRHALDELWRELLGLPAWILAVVPKDPETPFSTRMQGNGLSVFAFTDSARLEAFYRDNGLVPAGQDGVLYLSLEPKSAIPWLQKLNLNHGLESVFFNFGGHGWYSPIRNLAPICKSLGYHH
jgi:hypothetical protein